MLYYLFTWLERKFDLSGAGLFQFITFRAAMAIVLSLFIATVYGKRVINLLKRKQIGETVRDLGLAGEQQKKGTPTMGGIIILLSILIPTLLFADLNKVYVRLMLLCTVWLDIIGFLDDYLKLKARRKAQERGEKYEKKDSHGLAGVSKIIGATLYFSNSVTVERELIEPGSTTTVLQRGEKVAKDSNVIVRKIDSVQRRFVKVKTP